MDPKLLTESCWKTVAAKSKIKDNGLQRALSSYEKLDDDEHDQRLKAITTVSQLAGSLKRAKEVAALVEVVKYLTNMLAAADAEQREITKAKAEAEKAKALAAKTAAAAGKKAEVEAKKRENEEDEEDKDEEEEETGDYSEKLKAAFKRLKGSKQLVYNFIVCDAKPQCGFIMSKQRISSQHKAELTKVTGSRRFLNVGTCHVDGGKLVFEMEKAPPGLAAKLKKSFKYFTGLNVGVILGDQSDEDDKQ